MAYKKLILFILIAVFAVTLFSVLTYSGEKKECSAECSGKEGTNGCMIGCGYLNMLSSMSEYRTYSVMWLVLVISVLYMIMMRNY